MSCSPADSHVASPWLDPVAVSSAGPASHLAIESEDHDTLVELVMIESDGNDTGHGQEEDTEEDGPNDNAAAVTRGWRNSVIAVDSEVHTANAYNADNEVLPPNQPPILKEPHTRPISLEQLVAEVKGIYVALTMVESKCIAIANAWTPNGPEAQSRPPNGTQQLDLDGTSPEGLEAEEAFEESVAAHKHSVQDADLSYQEPHASCEEAGDSGKVTARVMPQTDTTYTTLDTFVLAEKTEPEIKAKQGTEMKPKIERLPLVENRPLHDRNLYKKVGNQYYMLVKGIWIPSLSRDKYEALIMLHRTLLHEHYDFFLASQHPKASPALRKLAKRYTVPARMWNSIRAFIKLLYRRLPETLEFTEHFILLSYSIISSLDETVPELRYTWAEMKGDLARYRWATRGSISSRQRWKYICQEEYTRVSDDDPTVGRLYYRLAILERPQCLSQSVTAFEVTVLQLFYLTKSLIVKTPFFAAQDTLLAVIDPIITWNKEKAGELARAPLTDKDRFLTAVANLILASSDTKSLRAHSYTAGKEDYLQAVYTALQTIGHVCADQAQASRIRPSAQLGLLLCQLLLGIPPAAGRWSPMMATWAPHLVTPADRADLSASMANARDIHNATIAIIHTMISYLLDEPDTRDLRFWEFIYVVLVFMRSLKTRPDLLGWFGYAFHAEMLAPFLNMLLREDETRGGRALESASQSELSRLCSTLNQKEKPGVYGFNTIDNIKRYRQVEEHEGTEEAPYTVDEITVTLEDPTPTTAETITLCLDDTAHGRDRDTTTPDAEQIYTNPLPEDELLRGHFFAREADELCGRSLAGFTEDAVVTIAANREAELTQQEHKQKEREAEEARQAEVQRQEGLLRDPPLFPAGWFKNSKYDFDERQVRQGCVQDAETYNNRSGQLLCLAVQLIDIFFSFETDESGRYWISVPGVPYLEPDPNMKMPAVVERDGGVRVVYVDPAFSISGMEKEIQNEMEENAKAAIGVATAVDAEERSVKFEGLTKCVLDTIRWTKNATKAIHPTNVDGADEDVDGADEDEDGWAHISNESGEDAQTGQRPSHAGGRSMILRYLSNLVG